MTESQAQFIENFDYMAERVYQNAIQKGFYETPPSDSDRVAHIHGEVSEAWEWLRQGNPPSDHIPEFLGTEEEVADAVIRLMDWARYRGWRLGEAIIAKHEYNLTRPFKHGKKF